MSPLHIDLVIGNPPWNLDRELVSFKFLYRYLESLKPQIINIVIPVSTSDPRLGSNTYEHQYVREFFYGSDHLVRTIDAYRGYLMFKDQSKTDLGCIDGGCECLVWDYTYSGKCKTTFFANDSDKLSFQSSYYFIPESQVRLRHPTDCRIVHHLYPFSESYLDTPRLDSYIKNLNLAAHSDDEYCVTIAGAYLHYLHELRGSDKKANLDIRMCKRSDYVSPNESSGMGVHRRLLACLPYSQAVSFMSYLNTKFCYYLEYITRTGRHSDYHNFCLIPLKPLLEYPDRVWTDSDIYKFFDLPQPFIEFIESEFSKIMPLTKDSVIQPYELSVQSVLEFSSVSG